VSEVVVSEVTLSEVIVPVVILTEAGLSEIVMSVIIVSKVIMPGVSLPEIVMPVMVIMPVLVDAPVTPVPHLVEPARPKAIQAAVGPHPGRAGVNATRMISQAGRFPGGHLSRLHALVGGTFLSHFLLTDVGLVGLRPGGEAPQNEPAGQQAGHDAFSPDFHCIILRIWSGNHALNCP
jgi:hypothetical protein